MALRRAIEGQTGRAILTELQAVASRLGAIEGALPLQAKPATIAQQIHEEAERLAESQARHAQAVRDGFEKGRETLAQVVYLEQRDRSILWVVGDGAALIGGLFGTMLFMEINRHAPDDWGWSAGWPAWLMQADPVHADYQLIGRNNSGTVAMVLALFTSRCIHRKAQSNHVLPIVGRQDAVATWGANSWCRSTRVTSGHTAHFAEHTREIEVAGATIIPPQVAATALRSGSWKPEGI